MGGGGFRVSVSLVFISDNVANLLSIVLTNVTSFST